MTRRLWLGLIGLSAVLLPSVAPAHAILVESVPAINASLPAGHLAIRLVYNSRIDVARSRLTVTGVDGQVQVLTLQADSPSGEMTATADLPPGAWHLRWQVLATDGHITRGDVPFTLTAP